MYRVMMMTLSLAILGSGCIGEAEESQRGEDVAEADEAVSQAVPFCAATSDCSAGKFCSVESGACMSLPGCNKPGAACGGGCYGICLPASAAPSATIGGFLFWDKNLNNYFDAGDQAAPSPLIQLFEDLDQDGQPDGAAVDTTETAPDGTYSFTRVEPYKSYVLYFLDNTVGFSWVTPNVGTDDVDSDVFSSGFTETITVGPGEQRLDICGGFYFEVPGL